MSEFLGDQLREQHASQNSKILAQALQQLVKCLEWYNWKPHFTGMALAENNSRPQVIIPIYYTYKPKRDESKQLRSVVLDPIFVKVANQITAEWFLEKYKLYARYEVTSSGANIVIKLYP